MTDKISKAQRSYVMSRIRSKNTRIELLLRKELTKVGLRYRIHFDLPGRPDIVFSKQRLVIFCDGCFWHGCPKCSHLPQSNKGYWYHKIQGNNIRAKAQCKVLKESGWIVMRFWEHDILWNLDGVVNKIVKKLEGIEIE